MLVSFALFTLAAPEAPLFKARDLTAGEEVISTTCGSPAKDFIIEVNGGGLISADFDLDGHLDLVVVDGSTLERVRESKPGFPARLLLGDGAGHFRAAGPEWELGGGTWGMGGSAGDVDNDGDPDLFLTEWGENRLFLNQGGQGFVDVSAGIASGDGEELKPTGLRGSRWSTSCAFLDYDGDGILDLVVINYLSFLLEEVRGPGDGCTWKGHDVMCGPEGMIGVHDQLFRGAGDGTFKEVGLAAGFRPDIAGFGLGVMTLDYDNDGDTDIYVSNDSTPNHLWENQGDGTFLEVGFRLGVSHDSNGKEQAGMGIACADINGDGRSDLFVTNFSGESNAFYRSSKRGFREQADVARLGGPSIQSLGWGTGIADYDLDGDLDLFVVNGHVYPQADRAGTDTTYAQVDQLFLGDGSGRFAESLLCEDVPRVSRAALGEDFDEDGDVDLVVIQMGGAVRYLENLAKHDDEHHWLQVRLVGTGSSNRAAIGARVQVVTEAGTQTGEVRTTAGYQAGNSKQLYFGLGAQKAVKELRITWPSGKQQVLTGVAVDQRVVVEEAGE